MTSDQSIITVTITGWNGLLGFHARCALLAENAALAFAGETEKYIVKLAPRLERQNIELLADQLSKTDLVLHLAGINRADDDVVENGNIELTNVLVDALVKADSTAHVVFANSTHSGSDTPYGRGKGGGSARLLEWSNAAGTRYTDVVLPHIFGEKGRAYYNNVTATLCQQIVDRQPPTIHEGAKVELLHAGAAVDSMLEAYHNGHTGIVRLAGSAITVIDLHSKLNKFKKSYDANQYPDLSSKLDESLFNVYRSFEKQSFPRKLTIHSDERGSLFEAVKGGGGGQTFLSWTEPGVERGNHFHRYKIERFLVVSGQADIKIRELFNDNVTIHAVSGQTPEVVDMPTLHTHSILNTGNEPLLTLFWAHEIFNPELPDTYAHPVSKSDL